MTDPLPMPLLRIGAYALMETRLPHRKAVVGLDQADEVATQALLAILREQGQWRVFAFTRSKELLARHKMTWCILSSVTLSDRQG